MMGAKMIDAEVQKRCKNCSETKYMRENVKKELRR